MIKDAVPNNNNNNKVLRYGVSLALLCPPHQQMAYLDKLIMLVGNSLNTLVDARPAKIVAGLEAENTNRLLQLMALAAVEKPDSSRFNTPPPP